MTSKTCTKCGNIFYRTKRMNDLTWRRTNTCGYKCKQNIADRTKLINPANFTFIKMKLSTHYEHNNPPSAVF